MKISGCDVWQTRWNESIALQGVGRNLPVRSVTDFGATIEANSLYCFEITVEPSGGESLDCDSNGVSDACEIASGDAGDCDEDGVPDTCETDIDRDAIPDGCEIAQQLPGDCNQEGGLDLSDGLCLLGILFLGQGTPPCSGSLTDPGNAALLDWQQDRVIDLSDAVALLAHLFLGGPPHGLGAECESIPGCESACRS